MQRENKCNCSANYPHKQFAHNSHPANFVQRENKWQDRFIEQFTKWIFHNEHGLCVFPDKITEFIQSEIDLAVKEEQERISKLLS